MSGYLRPPQISRAARLSHPDRLKKPEAVALLIFVGVSVVLDVISAFSVDQPDPIKYLISIGATASFGLYLWSSRVGISALGLIVVAAFFVHDVPDVITALAFAAFFVLRMCSASWILGYFAGLLVATGLMLSGFGGVTSSNTDVGAYLIFSAVAGGIGYMLRGAYAHGEELEAELIDQRIELEERELEAIRAERRWIAGELHDSIAHYLTIISLHSQLLGDESVRVESQEAIRSAAKRALSDLRFVIKLAEETSPSTLGDSTISGDLPAAIREARAELEAIGHAVVCEGDPDDENIPRGVDLIFARLVRESSTNIVKYAGPGEVHISVGISSVDITLTIESPFSSSNAPESVPSAGTGVNRMAQRVLGVSGTFSAGRVGDQWVVEAKLPITAD